MNTRRLISRLLSIETRKLLKHPFVWLELLAVTGIIALYFSARYAQIAYAARGGPLDLPAPGEDLRTGLMLCSFTGILFYAAAAAFISAYDFTDRGILMWLVRGVPRALLLLARLVVILAFSLVLAALSAAAIQGAAGLARAVFLGGASAAPLEWAQVGPSALRLFAASLPYLGLTVLLGAASRSPIFAAGGTVVYASVCEPALLSLGERFPALVSLLPARLSYVLMTSTTPALPQAALADLLLFVLLSALALLAFSRQEVGNG
jgi:hypothetical protein